MEILSIFKNLCAFWSISLAFSCFYGFRGAIYHRVYVVKECVPGHWQWYVLWYVQDCIYNFVCSMAGFLALRYLVQNPDLITENAASFGFLTVLAILGISGSMPRIFYRGFPK